MVGRRAVEQDARPHPVVGRGREALARCAGSRRCCRSSASPGRSAVAASKAASDCSTMPRAPSAIGEVRHQRDLADLRQRVEPQPRGAIGRRREAEPVHAAVHLEEDLVRLRRLVRRQPVDLRLVVDRVPEVQARAGLEVARLEAAFEQQDRAAPAERAQRFGFVQVEQREAVGGLAGRRRRCDAVAVGVGLDDRPDLGAAGARGARTAQVVREGLAYGSALRSGAASENSASRRIAAARPGSDKKPRAITAAAWETWLDVIVHPTATATRKRMKKGFYTIMSAQFFSSLADNALLVAAIELLQTGRRAVVAHPGAGADVRAVLRDARAASSAPSPTRCPRAR